MFSKLVTISALAALALAKTDYEGCTSSTTVVYGGASVMYWDPTNGEICQYLDCGGGRAPPKTNVPGCDAYEGTATYSPSYLPGWGEASSTSAVYTSPIPASQAYPTTLAGSDLYSTTIMASSTEMYSTTITASSFTTPVPSASGTGGSYPTGGNGTSVESPTLSTSKGPAEQTGAAAAVGAKQAVVGLMAGVFGLAML